MADFFKDKTKRIAHTSKFLQNGNTLRTPWTSTTPIDFGKYNKVSGPEKRKNIDDYNVEKVGGPKRIASGTVTIGTILSDCKLRKMMKQDTVAQKLEMMKLTMILRERDGSFTYDEALLIDRYYERALHELEESLSLQRREKLKRTNERKGIILEKSDLQQSSSEAIVDAFNDDLECKSLPIPKQEPNTSLSLPYLKHAEENTDSLGFDRENNGHSPVPVPVWQYSYPTHAGGQGQAKGGPEASWSDSLSYWANYLQSAENIRRVAPVEYFKQAPLADIWKSFALTGVFIEVENSYVEENKMDKAFWIGVITHYAGYLALVEFLSFNNAPDAPLYLTWINFASDAPKPLDWCLKEGITLDSDHIVPESVKNQKTFSTKLTNFYEQGRYRKNTIRPNHLQVISDNYKSFKSSCTHHAGPEPDVQRVFEPQNSDNVSSTRLDRSLPQAATGIFAQYKLYSNNTNTDDDIIITTEDAQKVQLKISVGMLLETRHPLLRHKIVGAVVTHVIHESFFVETREKSTETRVSFLFHLASPFIFPWGWGATFGIQVDFDSAFDSDLVLRSEELPSKRETRKFVPGLKLEALDEFNPQIGYPATIQKVADHLLLIRIDSTELAHQNQDLWVDVESSAIFPVGYCHSAGLKFLRG